MAGVHDMILRTCAPAARMRDAPPSGTVLSSPADCCNALMLLSPSMDPSLSASVIIWIGRDALLDA